jgi:hypothetical protein
MERQNRLARCDGYKCLRSSTRRACWVPMVLRVGSYSERVVVAECDANVIETVLVP